MQTSLSRRWKLGAIIGLCLALLAGCSALRLGYNQGPQLAQWWLDGYLDFNAEQSPRVKQALGQWFAWHRATQLNDYATLLAQAQKQVMAPLTPAQVCRWGDDLLRRAEPALERALPLAAEIVPTLTPAQLVHLEQRYAKSNEERRKEFLQPRAEDRLEASVERTIERFESFYGTLDETQRRLASAKVAASPFDAQGWFDERLRRQREVLRTLRQLRAEGADAGRALAALRALAERLEAPSQANPLAYQQRLTSYNCDFAAQIHNTSNAVQRKHARDKLRAWEDDIRELAGGAQPTQAQAASTR